MPKVLRIINRFNIGGPTYNATFLSKFLDEKYETLLIGGLPEEGEADSLYITEKYGVKPLIIEELKRIPSAKTDREAYRKIVKIIQEFKPDIVHTHASKAGALGRRAAFKCKVPIVIHTFHGHVFHSYFGSVKTFVIKTIERYLAKRSSVIIAISETQKRELCQVHRIADEAKVKVVPLGFDLQQFQDDLASKRRSTRTCYDLDDDTVAIAIVGRLTKIKNHAFFLRAVEALLQQTQQKVKIFIVGDGDLKDEIEAQVKAIGDTFPEKITMTSWIKDIASFNAGMDLICLSSDNEGTPVSLIEAQACSVPVLTTNVGGVKDIIADGKTGFVVEKGDLNAYVEKLLYLVNNKNIRSEMSQNGWAFVRDKFHYTRLANDMSKLYDELYSKLNRK